nr:MAG TPA: integrase [Caudoviricetes sp.]
MIKTNTEIETKDSCAHVAIYIRVSTDFQAEEGYSIDAQKEQLTAYCVAKGWKNYQYYIDGGYSGSSLKRPEIQRLIQNAKNNLVSNCLVFKLDRLSRSQKDTLYVIEDVFNKHNVGFISLNESMDTTTPMGRLMIGILSAFAQLERENIQLRTKMGMKERVKNGFWMGGDRTPFGYDYDQNQGILIPNKDADTVRKIYALYIQGFSAQRIADIVGLGYERLAQQILLRKTYLGIIEYNGEEYQGKHEPIISKETYNKAMQIMENRKKGNLTTASHLLTGLLYCGKCGAKMQYRCWGKKGDKVVCYSQQTSKKYLIKDPCCNQEKLWADNIEKIVVEDIMNFALEYQDKEDNEIKISIKDTLIQQANLLKKKIKNLFNLYSESENEILLETIKENQKTLNDIEKQIEMGKREQAIFNNKKELKQILKQVNELWEYMTFIEHQTLIRNLVDKIILTDSNVTVKYKI